MNNGFDGIIKSFCWLILIAVISLSAELHSQHQQYLKQAEIATQEGITAGQNGVNILANPYKINKQLAEHWSRGWIKGQTEDAR